MQNSVKYYEYIWNSSIVSYLKKSALFISQNTQIPVDELKNANSLDELSQTYALPLKYVNSLMIGAIVALANDYISRSSRSKVIPSRMFILSTEYYSNKERVQQLVTKCLNILDYEINHNCIDEVKCILEAGLNDSSLYPQDNFPKLV